MLSALSQGTERLVYREDVTGVRYPGLPADAAHQLARHQMSRLGSVVSFVLESLCIALVGGLLGCVVVLPLNGLTTGTINWQTFSHLAFAFRVTPDLLAMGIAFALLMGLVGGVPPAIRAARARIAVALREL